MDRRHVWLLTIRGIAALAFGILALVWPGITLIALAIVFGAYAIVNGVVTMVTGFRRPRDPARRAALAILGLLSVIAGLLALVWPGMTALVLVVLFGAWAVVTGAMEIWAATRIPGQWLPLVFGTLTMIAGILVLIRPAIGAVALAFTIGVYAIIAGIVMLAESWRVHRRVAGPRGRMAPAGA